MLLFVILISITIAVVVVVVLKFLGHDNPTVAGGAITGGIVGALSSIFLKGKKKK